MKKRHLGGVACETGVSSGGEAGIHSALCLDGATQDERGVLALFRKLPALVDDQLIFIECHRVLARGVRAIGQCVEFSEGHVAHEHLAGPLANMRHLLGGKYSHLVSFVVSDGWDSFDTTT